MQSFSIGVKPWKSVGEISIVPLRCVFLAPVRGVSLVAELMNEFDLIYFMGSLQESFLSLMCCECCFVIRRDTGLISDFVFCI